MPADAPVGRTALRLAPLIVLGRGAGFLFPVMVAHLYGVSGWTDAFFFAQAIPIVLVVVLTNAVGAGITPILARLPRERHASFVGRIGTMASVMAVGAIAVLASFLSPALATFSAFSTENQVLCTSYVLALAPFSALSATAVVARAAADIHGLFAWAATAPLPRSLAMLATLWLMAGHIEPWALPLAVTVGALAEVTWLLRGLARCGVRPVPGLGVDSDVRAALRDALPLLVGQTAAAGNMLVDRIFAGSLPTGSVSVLDYADKLRLIPQTMLEGTLLPVAFATWAHQLAREEPLRYARQLDQSLRWVALLAAPALAGLYVGRYVAVELLFVRGEFSAEDATDAARAFGWFLPGLLPFLLGGLALRAHIVERRLRLVLLLGLGSLVSKTALDALLIGPFGVDGLVMSSALTWCVIHGTYLFALRARFREAGSRSDWAITLAVVAASAALALAIEWGPGPPREIGDPYLWLGVGCCSALLACGIAVSRKAA